LFDDFEIIILVYEHTIFVIERIFIEFPKGHLLDSLITPVATALVVSTALPKRSLVTAGYRTASVRTTPKRTPFISVSLAYENPIRTYGYRVHRNSIGNQLQILY
jgi:hypothetical protein